MKAHKLGANITILNFTLAYLSLAIYSLIRIYNNFIILGPAKGDEESFLIVFKQYLGSGFYNTNVEGNSTIHNVISSFFHLLTNHELLSLRLTSALFGVLTFIILWKFQKKYFKLDDDFCHLAFITALNVVVVKSFVFFGINDTIIVFLTIAFFYLLFKIKLNDNIKYYHYSLLGLILSSFIATRLMSILIFPSIIIALGLVLKKINTLRFNKNNTILITSFIVFLALFNLPSLLEKGNLSFHQKASGVKGVTWGQFQYLSAIEQEKGNLKHNEHVSWDQANEYLKLHGKKSLPSTIFESLTYDVKRTINEFFKDLLLLIQPFTRLLGVVFLISLPIFLIEVFNKKIFLTRVYNNEIFMFSLVYTLIICFIIISNVEVRWLTNILILLPVIMFNKISKTIKKQKNKEFLNFSLINIQLLAILVFNLGFILKNIHS